MEELVNLVYDDNPQMMICKLVVFILVLEASAYIVKLLASIRGVAKL